MFRKMIMAVLTVTVLFSLSGCSGTNSDPGGGGNAPVAPPDKPDDTIVGTWQMDFIIDPEGNISRYDLIDYMFAHVQPPVVNSDDGSAAAPGVLQFEEPMRVGTDQASKWVFEKDGTCHIVFPQDVLDIWGSETVQSEDFIFGINATWSKQGYDGTGKPVFTVTPNTQDSPWSMISSASSLALMDGELVVFESGGELHFKRVQ